MVVQAKRKAQGAVDIAAMLAAAGGGSRPTRSPARSLADNGYGSAATVTVSPGSYAGNAKVAPARPPSRPVPAPPTPSAWD